MMKEACICAVDPLWLDVLWSLFGLLVGIVIGYVLRDKRDR